MADLLLDEERVVVGFDQVRHVGVAQAVEREFVGQTSLLTGPGKGALEGTQARGAGPFGGPQGPGAVRGGETPKLGP